MERCFLEVNNRQFRPRSSSHATSFTIPPSISSNMWPATEKDATRRPRILPPLYSRTALPLVIGRGPAMVQLRGARKIVWSFGRGIPAWEPRPSSFN
ncbi:hypothetical protein OPV22_013565 [Ensete ventricosum]|uniref:Uncharacterized protein n=1 Tax=Ensete ventricosum TaxID=4639 RepID=A0AAV8PIE0_ENSVE|nr:hypothetical protein OPV22_013565 [Ensete ventricosum]